MAKNFSVFDEVQNSPAESVVPTTQAKPSGNFSVFDTDEQIQKKPSGNFSVFDTPTQTQTKQQAQPTEPVKYTMDTLVKNKDWLDDAKTIYKDENEGKDFKGSDKSLDYWFRNRHTRLNNDLTNMGMTAYDASELMDDNVKRAWNSSKQTYEAVNPTVGSAANSIFQAVTDPLGLIGTAGSMVLSGIAAGPAAPAGVVAGGIAFRTAAAAAAKKAFTAGLKSTLKTKVGKKVLKEAAKKEAKTNSLAKTAVKSGIIAGGYTGTEDLLEQSIMIDLQEAEENPSKTETDYLQTLAIAGIAGVTFGLGGAAVKKGIRKVSQKKAIKREAAEQELLASQAPKLAETTKTYAPTDTPVTAREFAEQGQRELEEGGILNLNVEKNIPQSDISEINRELNELGFSELFKSGSGYSARKVVTLRQLAPETPTVARTRTQKILARIGSGLRADRVQGTTADATRRVATRQRGRDTARQKSEREIATAFERLKKAAKNDLGVETFTPAQAKLINSALRGVKEATDELAQTAPKVLDEVRNMRSNIVDNQQRLLDTGAIKEGSNLEAKIISSMGGNKNDELYLTTSYEKFDNPNWSKEVATREGKNGGTILEEAREFITGQARKRDVEFGAVYSKVQRGIDLNPAEQKIYDKYMSTDGEINNTITKILDTNEDDVIKVFSKDAILGRGPMKILAKKNPDIPEQIKMLMGEYEDPFVNYAKTVSKLNQTIAQIDYEKEIVDLANQNLLSGVRRSADSSGDFIPVAGKLPKRTDVVDPLSVEDIDTGMKGIYAYPEIADALINGNEIAQTTLKPLQAYLALQGHTRAAKTVWSPTAIARNFIGAGWMAAGAGYLSPRNLREIPKVMKGLYRMNDEELNVEMEKGIALGYLQSGTDLGTFRAALSDAGDNSFWNFTKKSMTDKKTLRSRAKKLNVEAVKFYQSMDDMWKQFAFINERNTYKQPLLDMGGDPDKVVRTLRSGDGRVIEITELDEYAANEVAKHMQNYAGVPQFVRAARLLPAADFFAFTTEIIRTQKNIIKTALNDMKQGRELMKLGEEAVDVAGNKTGLLKGQAQSVAGQRRLGSIIAAQSAAPALAAAGYAVTGMDQPAVDKNGDELPFTIKEGFEAFDQPWQKGADFLYLGAPDKGKARRINLSYLNPWSKTQDPIRAGMRALSSGRDIDSSLNEAFAESMWQPLKETFGFSMLADASLSMLLNVDEYGKPLFNETDTAGEKFRTGVATTLETFEPGFVKTVLDMKTSLNATDSEIKDTFGVGEGFTRSGRIKRFDDQIAGLSGVKPETINVRDTLGFKLNAIKRNMGESGKAFKRAYQQRTPVTSDELIDAYEDGMRKEFAYAQEMFDVITKAKSIGLSNQDIISAITDDGLFSKRLDKKMLYNLVNRGVFIPAPPNMSDIYKWGISTKKRTGSKPPIKEAQREIFNVYRRYAGASTGER